MKKLALTIAIVLGLGMSSFAQGGLFQRGEVREDGFFTRETGNSGMITPAFPDHGSSDNQDAPLGSGIAVLMGLGAAYLVSKKRKED